MKDSHDIILKPVLTEKSYDQLAEGKYTFLVDIRANKTQIKRAIEEVFEVEVARITTSRQQGKLRRQGYTMGRKPTTKKAVVKLAPGSKSIEFFEGMA